MKYVVTIRGRLKGDKAEAQKVHDTTVSQISTESRAMGSTGHQAYLNPQDEKDFLAIDFWNNLEGIQKLYSDPNLAEQFGELFDGEPEVVVWASSGWEGYFDAE